MHVELTIRHRQGWIPNPDYVAEKFTGYYVDMPGGFQFCLPGLAGLEYAGKGRSCFHHPARVVFCFDLPVGRIYHPHDSPSRPRCVPFDAQTTWFERQSTTMPEYTLSIRTLPETQGRPSPFVYRHHAKRQLQQEQRDEELPV